MKFNFNKESGQVARLLLVLAIIVLVAAVITYLVLRMAEKPIAPTPVSQTPAVPLPVYEKQLGNIRFIFESSIDRGKVLYASEIANPQYRASNQKDQKTSERYIQVTVGAQNMGKENTELNAWDLGNIVDSEGRNFVPLGYNVNPWLPNPNPCGALLKPAFEPTPCTQIYEVSKESSGLKITVKTGKNNKASSMNSDPDMALLDLIIK